MAGRIPQHFIDELLNRIDIVEIIDARVPLKRAGREYQACCPFHNEKTPSFTVSPEKQFYHCFGCGVHGSAIGFLMEYERLEFVDAIEELAEHAGLQIPREESVSSHSHSETDSSLGVLDQAAKYYRHQLKNAPQSARAVEYLKQRGLTGETAANFGIGYAPSGWDNLIVALQSKKIDLQQMLDAGLIIKKDNGGYYDRFRDRIMFPIRDRRGRVIAFGGRILEQQAGAGSPKYLNSPETALFHKGKELYGLYEARQANRQLDRLIVVEGYMDVVSLAQFGISNVVATLGTATTQEHLERLYRVVSEVVFCFDGDRAGRQAAWRALTNALTVMKEGRHMRFMFLPQGEDPDTIVRTEGQSGFEQRMQDAIPFSSFFYDSLSSKLDLETPEGQSGLYEKARPLLAKLSPGVFRDMMLDKLEKINQMSAKKLSTLITPETGEPAPTRVKKPVKRGGLSPVRLAIRLLLEYPKLAQLVDLERLEGLELPGIALLVALIEYSQSHPQTTCGAIIEHWRGTEHGHHLSKLIASPLSVSTEGIDAEFEGAIQILVITRIEQRIDALLEKAKAGQLDPEQKAELTELNKTKVLVGKSRY